MPSFMLRAIDPALWLRVQAKAVAEGLTVKALILKAIAQYVALPLFVLLTVGCAYHAPDGPTPLLPIADSVPFTLSLGAVSGLGADAGHATITAKVQNVKGAPMNGVVVAFLTNAGTLSQASVTTDATGQATTVITAATSAAITATAGTLTTHTLVVSQPVVVSPSLPPSTDPTTPDPAPPLGPLSVTLTATEVIVGGQTLFAANVKNGPASSFVWSFGDGQTFTGISATTAHTYGAAGVGIAGVTITDALGRSASATTSVTVDAIPPPPPPAPAPPPALTATLTVSAPSVVAVTGGQLTFTVAVTNLNAAETIIAYQWDLDGVSGFEGTALTTTRSFGPYPTAGLFTARVLVTTSTGRTALGTVGFVVTN